MPDKKQPETMKQPEATGDETAAPAAKAVELVAEAARAAVEVSLPPRGARPGSASRREAPSIAAAPIPVAPPVVDTALLVAASEPMPDAPPAVDGAFVEPPQVEPPQVEPQPVEAAAAPVADPVAATPAWAAPAPSLSMPSLPMPNVPMPNVPLPNVPLPSVPGLASPSLPTASIPNRHTMETMMTTAEELISFQQGNLEALMKSGQIWAAGLQDMSRHWAAAAQATMDETMGTVKAMAQVKSLREAMELQSTLARTSVEKVVSEGGKLTDASLKLAEQTFAPITARLTLAAERFGRPTA